ncbi:MAG: hypothetical protein KF905_14835 [Flavobacteriales bacterium]|nr:hypothetical protein [Flavobacteriales bacterium]
MRILAVLLLLVHHAIAAQSWVQLPDFPGMARDDAASFHWNDKIFVGTGMDVGFQLTNDWYAYSMTTESWEAVASLPASGRQYCNGFRLSDERGYLFGGVDANGPLNELWRYDPITDAWTQLASLPAAGRYACAVIVAYDQVFICGGLLDGGIPTTEVWRYDTNSDSWEPRSPMPGTPRHRAAVVDNLVVGGADSSFQALSEAYAYNHLNDQWTERPGLPAPRFGAASVDHLHFCGASSLAQNHDEVLVYDWLTGDFNASIIPPFPGGPRKGGIAQTQHYIADVGIFFFGLGIDGPTRFNDWWRMDYGTGIGEHAIPPTKVFPNPASTQLQAEWPMHWTVARYDVLDATGRSLRTGVLAEATPLDITDLGAGRYEVHFSNGDERLRAPFIKLP